MAAGRRIALVEDQVHDPEHAAQPVRKLLVGRHPVRDVGVGDLALGPHDPLAHRRLGDQECARDLARRQSAKHPQRQCDLGRLRKRRMAAGEDQPQPVVDDRAGFGRGLVALLGRRRQLGEPSRAVGQRSVAAQAIDCPASRCHGDPRPGPAGQAVPPPRGHCVSERILDRVLGELEVAHLPDQRGQDGWTLVAERLGDRVLQTARLVVLTHSCSDATSPGAGPAPMSMIGRTSIEP